MRFKAVPAVGKTRPMGIPNYSWDLLGPLHKVMYDHLTKKKWLLRGAPTAERMSKVCTGQYQTSIDLVAATDGLSTEIADVILSAAFSKSAFIPPSVMINAHDSLYPIVQFPRKGRNLTGQVVRGQMMGAYLSFPLLCIQSYIAARWAVREERDNTRANLLVNGDDVVISWHRPVENSDYPSGFNINESKTMRAMNAVEINSTPFIRIGRRWREVPICRRATMYGDLKGRLHTAAACQKAGPAWVDAFIKSGYCIKSSRSFDPRDLGLWSLSRDWLNSLRTARYRGRWTFPTLVPLPSRFERLEVEPSYADRIAFWNDLFSNGREGGSRDEVVWQNLRFCKPEERQTRPKLVSRPPRHPDHPGSDLTRVCFSEQKLLYEEWKKRTARRTWCHVVTTQGESKDDKGDESEGPDPWELDDDNLVAAARGSMREQGVPLGWLDVPNPVLDRGELPNLRTCSDRVDPVLRNGRNLWSPIGITTRWPKESRYYNFCPKTARLTLDY
jgi:phosphoribosylcarboxyaminoimidazole (NCAIR) mutase